MRKGLVTGLVAGLLLALVGTAAADHLFPDVPDGHTHAEGIHWATEQGLMQGFGDGTFRPSADVTRGQLATVLHNQNAYRGPQYLLTPLCGELTMSVTDLNEVGSGAATVEFSVDGGDRLVIEDGIPAEGSVEFDPGESGIVSLFVDGLAWAHAPTAESCSPADQD